MQFCSRTIEANSPRLYDTKPYIIGHVNVIYFKWYLKNAQKHSHSVVLAKKMKKDTLPLILHILLWAYFSDATFLMDGKIRTKRKIYHS